MRWMVLLLLASCGDSPLFNHVKTPDAGRFVRSVEDQRFPRSNRAFDLVWQTGCPSFDACSFTVNLKDPLDSGEELFAELWMPSMGHGSSPFTVRALGPTSWEFSDVYFIMPGNWEVVLKIKSGGQAIDEIRLDYRL